MARTRHESSFVLAGGEFNTASDDILCSLTHVVPPSSDNYLIFVALHCNHCLYLVIFCALWGMGWVMLRSIRCNPALLESLDFTGQWDVSHVTIKRYCKLRHLHNQAGFVRLNPHKSNPVKAMGFEIMMSSGVWGEMENVTPSSLISHKISKFFRFKSETTKDSMVM